jgi:signal transduction histidine kinase
VAEVERILSVPGAPDPHAIANLVVALDRLRPVLMSFNRAMIRQHTAELTARSHQHLDDLYIALALLGACTLGMALLIAGLFTLNARQRDLSRHLEALVDERTCALRQARDEALSASQAKSRFLAQMSHELRTPLNSVIGFAEVMQQEIFGRVESERYRDYVANIHGSATLLLSLVNDLLDIGRIESGELKLRAEPVALTSMISDVVEAQTPHRQGICAIRTDLPRDLPKVMAEPKALRRMLANLLNNAIKFTPLPGEVRVSAAIQAGGAVAVEIADDGPGISPERLARLTRPFLKRDEDPYVRSSACGLGLGIASALAEALGVGFAIESHDGGGTTVRLTLPVAA